jgi:hypothetical protein
MKIIGKVAKVDVERRQVFGWVWVSEIDGDVVVDSQGDIIDPDTLEKAVYGFVLNSRVGKEMHAGDVKSRLIESIVFTKEKQKALGIDLGRIGWWVGFQIDDADMWQKIKDGKYTDFSLSGTARREETKT